MSEFKVMGGGLRCASAVYERGDTPAESLCDRTRKLEIALL